MSQVSVASTWALGKGVSVLAMVTAFMASTSVAVPYRFAPRRHGDLPAFWTDAGKAERELGWRAERGLEEMMADTWRWQSLNPHGFDS
ncbi:GDP-mannose 4,6-dehydratase [Halomonas denitrificans]|uniref:GDP-mannose 4,6-dehydratase n=1 Tax=Halomonas denitrificans TaxID=370769 RepID=UPI0031834FC0